MNRGRGLAINHQGSLGANTQSSAYNTAKSFNRSKNLIRRDDFFDESMKAAGLTGIETGTKLYISNLDYGVSDEDIKELFSEIGVLKKSAVHYDSNGKPTGSAEVVFIRRSDAVAALKRYNNVQLDGKTMKIEIIGINLGLAVMPRVSIAGGANGRVKRTVVMTPDFHNGQGVRGGAKSFKQRSGPTRGNFSQHGRGRGRGQHSKLRGGIRGSGRGRGQHSKLHGGIRGGGRGKKQEISVEQLDKDLGTYGMQ